MTIDKIWKGKYKCEPFKYEKKAVKYYYRQLKSGYFENQGWGALHKAWLGVIPLHVTNGNSIKKLCMPRESNDYKESWDLSCPNLNA